MNQILAYKRLQEFFFSVCHLLFLIAKQSFYGLMQEELAKKTDYHRKVFGLDE